MVDNISSICARLAPQIDPETVEKSCILSKNKLALQAIGGASSKPRQTISLASAVC